VAARGGEIRLLRGGLPVLAYRRDPVSPPPGIEPRFARAGYLHPIFTPDGDVLTGDFPADHPHQRGLFFAWTSTRIRLGDRELAPDFWNLGSETGRTRPIGARTTSAPAGFDARHVWEARHGAGWTPVLDERFQVRLSPPLPGSDGWSFDLVSRQTPRVELVLPRNRYGGLGVRMRQEWSDRGPETGLLTGEGRSWTDGEDRPARWAALFGPGRAGLCGLAVLEHPDNPGAPSHLRVPPQHPYVVFSPSKARTLVLSAGREARFRYRCVVFRGRPDPAGLEAEWRRFAGEAPRS
jgi:hypothetical protein